MNAPSCKITRQLCLLVTMARGELRIGTADLQEEIGLDHVAQHSTTLAAVLKRARKWFAQERGIAFEWEFIGRDIVLRYSISPVTPNAPTTCAMPKRRIVLVT